MKVMNIPSGLPLMKETEAAVCHYTEVPQPIAIMLTKTGKKVFYNRFHTVAAMMARIEASFAYLKDKADTKAKYLAEKRANRIAYDAATDFKVGDIVVNTWGYDQTQADFFKVQSLTKGFLTMVAVATKITESSPMSMCGTSMPVIENETGKPERHSVYKSGVQTYIRFKYGCGQKWDGRPVQCSWYA